MLFYLKIPYERDGNILNISVLLPANYFRKCERIVITCYDAEEFIQLIQNKRILIYGAGYVASIFVEALKKHGLEKSIYGFAVTENVPEQRRFEEYWVKSIDQVDIADNIIVCIAVHEAVERQIETTLLQKGIINYIWIYPFLYTLYMGQPVKEKQWIDVNKMILQYGNTYGMAVRWAAIDDYYGNFQGGLDLYKKAMKIHCSEATAEERAHSFIGLMQNWDVRGYDANQQISINLDYEIIDGEHRVSLAFYHHQRFLQCKIYKEQNMHKEKVLMTKDILLAGGFTQKELERLDGVKEYIKKSALQEKV